MLRAFQGKTEALGLLEIVHRTQLAKATVARLVHTLSALGYVSQTSNRGKYMLNDRSAVFGRSFMSSLPVTEIARPRMSAFAAKFDVSVALGTRVDNTMVYMLYCAGITTTSLRVRGGSIVPLCSTAMGQAYLASLDPSEFKSITRRFCDGDDNASIKSDLESKINSARNLGYTRSFGGWAPEVISVGAPLKLPSNITLALAAIIRREGNDAEAFAAQTGPALVSLSEEIGEAFSDQEDDFWGS